MKRLIGIGLIVLGLAGCVTARDEERKDLDELFTCANELLPPYRPDTEGTPDGLRGVRPSAGGVQDKALYEIARLIDSAYAMYRLFDEGGDPMDAFPHDDLTFKALITGNPGRNTERRGSQGRARTLYGYWAYNPNIEMDVIILRGTLTVQEWIRNLQVNQQSFAPGPEGARVHKGFMAIYDSFALEGGSFDGPFRQAVQDGLFADRDLGFIGHSLGGALASLGAMEVARTDWNSRVHLLTVASPRVGNGAFAEGVDALITADRMCNLVDLVPMVPPSTDKISFVHIGTPLRHSSFDHDAVLENDLESKGAQIGCWHSHHIYAWMLNHDHPGQGDPACWAAGE